MKGTFFSIALLCVSLSLYAADSVQMADSQKMLEQLPGGYGEITLGMSVSEVKEALKANREFGYRGDRDVSLSPSTHQTLIETDATYAGYSYVTRCWFQFVDDKLYIITINLNQDKVDHYAIFSKLCEKYGTPHEISPRKSQWTNDEVMMSLERPLTLKYIDKKVYEERLDAAQVEKTYGEQNRDAFLEGL